MIPDHLPAAAQANDLTNVLRGSGALSDAPVLDVIVESDRPTMLSRISRLRLTYDRPAPATPATVILRTGLPHTMDNVRNGGRQKVEFYTHIAPMLPADVRLRPPVARG